MKNCFSALGFIVTVFLRLSLCSVAIPERYVIANDFSTRLIQKYLGPRRLPAPGQSWATMDKSYGFLVLTGIPTAKERVVFSELCGIAFLKVHSTDEYGVIYKVSYRGKLDQARAWLATGIGDRFFNLEPVTAQDRISRKIADGRDFSRGEMAGGGMVYASVVFFPDVGSQNQHSQLRSFNLQVVECAANQCVVRGAPADLRQIGNSPGVERVHEINMRLPVRNFRSRLLTGVDSLQNVAGRPFPPSASWESDSIHWHGDSIVIGVYDTGIDSLVKDFREGAIGNSLLRRSAADTTWAVPDTVHYELHDYVHGTHVAGIIKGNGWQSDTTKEIWNWRGIAPKALGFSKYTNPYGREGDVNNHSHVLGDTAGSGKDVDWYNEWCHFLDDRLTEHFSTPRPHIVVYSAGNQGITSDAPWTYQRGYYSIDANAKNPIVVGAVYKETGVRADFSSMGPTRDGRIKPDVMAPGASDWLPRRRLAQDSLLRILVYDIMIVDSTGSNRLPARYLFNQSSDVSEWAFTNNSMAVPFFQPGGGGYLYCSLFGTRDEAMIASPASNVDTTIITAVSDTLVISYRVWPPIAEDTTLVDSALMWVDFGWRSQLAFSPVTGRGRMRWHYDYSSVNLRIPLSQLDSIQGKRWGAGDTLCGISLYFGFDKEEGVYSTNVSQQYGGQSSPYQYMQGTSMAAPHVTGIVALMLDKYRRNYLGAGQNIHDDAFWNSTAKALLIHTSSDLKQPGARNWYDFNPANPDFQSMGKSTDAFYLPGPDFATGWGLVNAKKAVDYVDTALFKEDSIDHLQRVFYTFTVPDPAPANLRVTLAWDDPGCGEFTAATFQKSKLINDLDLHLSSPNQTIFYPWVLDPLPQADTLPADGIDPIDTSDVKPAYRGIDRLNNVEVVDVDNPQSGQWTIVVTGTRVPGPDPQDFSIVTDYSSSITSPDTIWGNNTKWIFRIPGGIFGGPAAQMPVLSGNENRLYLGLEDGTIYALGTTDSGKVKWTYKLPDSITAAPSVRGDTLLLSTRNRIHKIVDNGDSARHIWQTASIPTGAFNAIPALDTSNMLVYAGATNDTMYAYMLGSGSSKWKRKLSGPVQGAATVANGLVFVGTVKESAGDTARVFALRDTSGTVAWSYQLQELAPQVEISATGGNIYFVDAGYIETDSAWITVLNGQTGALIRQTAHERTDYPARSLSIHGNDIYAYKIGLLEGGYHGIDSVLRIDQTTGMTSWSYALPTQGVFCPSNPILGRDMKLYAPWFGNLYVLDPADSAQNTITPLPGWSYSAGFIARDNTLYTVCYDPEETYLIATTTTAGGMVSSYPCRRFDTQNSGFLGGDYHAELSPDGVGLVTAGSGDWDSVYSQYEVCGASEGIAGTGDHFEFSYNYMGGDFEATAKIVSIDNTNSRAKAGIMARASLYSNAQNGFIALTPSAGSVFQFRPKSGGATDSVALAGYSPGTAWVKLRRTGSRLAGYVSSDGVTFTKVGECFIGTGNLLVGLAHTSSNTGQSGCALFDDIRFSYLPREDYGQWEYSKRFTINTTSIGAGVESAVYDFPLLVRLDSTDFDFSAASADGADIRFSKPDSSIHLAYQIAKWDSAGGEGLVWVALDTVWGNADSQTIMMHYGKSGVYDESNGYAVFDTARGFEAVWRLDGSLADAGAGGYTGINDGTLDTTARVHRGRYYDGSNDLVNSTYDGKPAQRTFSTWLRWNGGGGDYPRVFERDPYNTFFINKKATSGPIGALRFNQDFTTTGGHWWTTNTLSSNTWHHVAIAYDNSSDANEPATYIDGQLCELDTTRSSTPSGSAVYAGDSTYILGNRQDKARAFSGTLDEIGISGVVRTPEWVKLSYETQRANQQTVSAHDDLSQWSYSRNLRLNTKASGANVSGDVTGFPVLISLTSSNFTFNQAKDGGADIRFSKPDGTLLPFQIEKWDDIHDSAEVWVRVDSIYGNDSSHSFVMYWGKPDAVSKSSGAGVFDTAGGFEAVWHLNGDFTDATAWGRTATNDGTIAARARIADGREYDGSNDLINSGYTGHPTERTWSVWLKWDGGGGDFPRLFEKEPVNLAFINNKSSSGPIGAIRFNQDFTTAGGHWWTSTTLSSGVWNQVVIAYDRGSSSNDPSIYVNGVLSSFNESKTSRPSGSSRTGDSTYVIGNRQDKARPFDGIFDEIRICSVLQSQHWVKLCYENQKANQSLIIFE